MFSSYVGTNKRHLLHKHVKPSTYKFVLNHGLVEYKNTKKRTADRRNSKICTWRINIIFLK